MEYHLDVELIKNIIDYGVIGVLALMAFVSVWIWIERVLFYSKIDINSYKSKERLEVELTSNLDTIATFGANAPYIGLLGTVLAIMVTFYSMGADNAIDTATIIKSLALALKATAMGLLVAIPSIFFYNHLSRRAEVIQANWAIIQESKSEQKEV